MLFVIVVPTLCILLLWHKHRSHRKYTVAGRILLYIGIFLCAITLFTYVPTITAGISGKEISLSSEIIGFLIWLIPSLFILLTGWSLQKRD